MKKGDISIQIIFIIVILTVVMFVLIGMFVQWTGKSKTFVKRLAKTNDEGYLIREDIVINHITPNSCAKYVSSIIQQAELCFIYGGSGQMDGELCYTVTYSNAGLCGAAITQVRNGLNSRIGAGNYTDGGAISDKTIISWDPQNSRVDIL